MTNPAIQDEKSAKTYGYCLYCSTSIVLRLNLNKIFVYVPGKLKRSHWRQYNPMKQRALKSGLPVGRPQSSCAYKKTGVRCLRRHSRHVVWSVCVVLLPGHKIASSFSAYNVTTLKGLTMILHVSVDIYIEGKLLSPPPLSPSPLPFLSLVLTYTRSCVLTVVSST